jgi:signal transduction histidine kinase
LIVSVPDAPISLMGDSERLAQLISNLLTNAAKYTPAGGTIWLTVTREDGEALIRVKDTGEGMAESLLSRVFDVFTQSERTLDRAQGGLGLGLAIVKNLVELHQGRIEAHSEGLGKGSEFSVWLPVLA